MLSGLKTLYLPDMSFSGQIEYLVYFLGWDFCCVQIAYDYRGRDSQAMWITKFRVVVGRKRGSYMKILHSTVRDACINGNWHARVDFSLMS